jgi:hypothetical protein
MVLLAKSSISRRSPYEFSERLIAELKREAESTRRMLERVPSDKLSWKPHKKSMSSPVPAIYGPSADEI